MKEVYKTKQKDIILNIIKQQKNSFTIKDIYKELKGKVGLTTIYRLIDKLVEENKLNKTISSDNTTYYQYLEECTEENHFYLKCDKCGNITHIDCDCIEELTSHIVQNHKFKPNKDHIIIDGICSKCIGGK
ncbi:MAG: transcriptional repressor [Bacilli bacterium]|nr:transcriptional repressor [Bacilli bacterium]